MALAEKIAYRLTWWHCESNGPRWAMTIGKWLYGWIYPGCDGCRRDAVQHSCPSPRPGPRP